jgi:hypothetical protein
MIVGRITPSTPLWNFSGASLVSPSMSSSSVRAAMIGDEGNPAFL